MRASAARSTRRPVSSTSRCPAGNVRDRVPDRSVRPLCARVRRNAVRPRPSRWQADGTTTVGAVDRSRPGSRSRAGSLPPATGQPLAGICATVFASRATPNSGGVQEQCTGIDGTYRCSLASPGQLPGGVHRPEQHLRLSVLPELGRLDAGHGAHPGRRSQRGSRPMSMRPCKPAAVISGRAVDALTGRPIKQACGSAYLGRSTTYPYGQTRNLQRGGRPVYGDRAGGPVVQVVDEWARTTSRPTRHRRRREAGARLYTTKVGQTLNIGDVRVAPGGTVSGVVEGRRDRAGRSRT